MKRWIALLTAALTAATLAACAGPNKDKGNENEGGTPPVEVTNGVVTLNSFDSQEVMNRLMLRGVLGKVELNTDESEYIKSGEGSAKVTVISDPYKMGQPTLYQATEFFKTKEDYSDFAKVSNLTLWVYNAQPAERRVGLQLVYSADSVEMTEWFNVKASAWTRLQFSVEREYLTVTNGKATVQGVNVIFNRGSADEVYYLDDFCLYRTDTSYTPVSMTLAENELCSFDKYWQLKKLGVGCWGALELAPSVSWVADVTSTGKGSAIRVETVPTGSGDQWPYVALTSTIFDLIDLKKYSGNDRLCFDVYSPELNGMDTVWMELYKPDGYAHFKSDPIPLSTGKWKTVSFAVSDLNASGNFANTVELRILHKGYTASSAKIFYVDNIRMEPAK